MEQASQAAHFPCSNCGADLTFEPGTELLTCEYCGTENRIEVDDDAPIEELDFHTFLHKAAEEGEHLTENFVKCDSCGATSTLEPNVTAASCPYCASPLVVENAHEENIIQPRSLLPFRLDRDEAHGQFKKWIKGLWFAPGDLKKATLSFDHFKGVYLPYWTYDTDTTTPYRGERGEHYWVEEEHRTRRDGEWVTETKRVRKTRWYSARGTVHRHFDDILVVATESLPEDKIYKLEPWDLDNLVPFDKKFLSGFIAEKYQLDLGDGFEKAGRIIRPSIVNAIERDIGGDEQRIHQMHVYYDDITFKHLLLPVYVSAYRYKDKVYQFLVNGRTGEVQGQRPYSWIKIALAIIAGLAVVGTLAFLFTNK